MDYRDAFAAKVLATLKRMEDASEAALERFAKSVDDLTPQALARVDGWEDDYVRPRLEAAQQAYAETGPRISEEWATAAAARRGEIAKHVRAARPLAATDAERLAQEAVRARLHGELAPMFEGGHGTRILARYETVRREATPAELFSFQETTSDLHQTYPEVLAAPGLGNEAEELRQGPPALAQARQEASELEQALDLGQKQAEKILRVHERRPVTALRMAQVDHRTDVWGMFSEPAPSDYYLALAGLSKNQQTRAARAAS